MTEMNCRSAFSQLQELYLFSGIPDIPFTWKGSPEQHNLCSDMETVTGVKIPAVPFLHWRR